MVNFFWFTPASMDDESRPDNFLTDYHVHSTYSPDAQSSLEQNCKRALKFGFREIAFTEHMEWHPDWQGAFKIKTYLRAIEEMKARYAPKGLTVYSGVEMGNPHDHPDEASALLIGHQFDVVIASLHWLRGTNIHLLDCFIGREPTDVYAEYFLEITRMSQCCDFDILAHFDRIFWPGWKLGALPNIGHLETVIRTMLSSLAERGQYLELNTKLLTLSTEWQDILVTIMGWFREAGGRGIVVNSDAHQAVEIGRNFELAATLVRQADFEVFSPTFALGHRERVVAC